jgi:hypothetical protein
VIRFDAPGAKILGIEEMLDAGGLLECPCSGERLNDKAALTQASRAYGGNVCVVRPQFARPR